MTSKEGLLKKQTKYQFPSCETCSKTVLPNPAQTCYDARHKYPSECPKDIWFDEAKRDCPLAVIKYLEGRDLGSEENVKKRMEVILTETYKWYKKWFGE